jgi:hypothetical protein
MWTIWYIPHSNKDYDNTKMIWTTNTEEEAYELLCEYVGIKLLMPTDEEWKICDTDNDKFEKLCEEKYPNFNYMDDGFIIKLENEKIDKLFGHMPQSYNNNNNSFVKLKIYEIESMKDFPKVLRIIQEFCY